MQPEVQLLSNADYSAALRARNGDPEKVPTAAVATLTYLGINIISRYQKARELEVMLHMIDALCDSEDAQIEIVGSIFCDSKASATYVVNLMTGTDEQAEEIGACLDAFLLRHCGGHNGIYLEGPGGLQTTVNPSWVGG